MNLNLFRDVKEIATFYHFCEGITIKSTSKSSYITVVLMGFSCQVNLGLYIPGKSRYSAVKINMGGWQGIAPFCVNLFTFT